MFSLKEVEALAGRFASSLLDDYVAEIRDADQTFTRKEINDAV
ncbi:hypothetical protein N825_28110 [Skermanella stibiiresistens SB22]|uniref:Uncharacterized protein n=1 Tax=Skermanella stibiiresistens SB22 TaxID=1385369 RepID=W9H5K6_9PROT|nr:hypothetical protein N825_28110 [Skermanella stibiiresistens SB22]